MNEMIVSQLVRCSVSDALINIIYCSCHTEKEVEEEQSFKLALRQPWVWRVSDFIFLSSAYGWMATPVPRRLIFPLTVYDCLWKWRFMNVQLQLQAEPCLT